MKLFCARCAQELTQPGGLLLSPPAAIIKEGPREIVQKQHVCQGCYVMLCAYIQQPHQEREHWG
jgi:hypothetical protein